MPITGAVTQPKPSLNTPPTSTGGMDQQFQNILKQYGGSQQTTPNGGSAFIGAFGNTGGAPSTPFTAPRHSMGGLPTNMPITANVNQGQMPVSITGQRVDLGGFGFLQPGSSGIPRSTGPTGLPPALQALMGSGSGSTGGGATTNGGAPGTFVPPTQKPTTAGGMKPNPKNGGAMTGHYKYVDMSPSAIEARENRQREWDAAAAKKAAETKAAEEQKRAAELNADPNAWDPNVIRTAGQGGYGYVDNPNGNKYADPGDGSAGIIANYKRSGMSDNDLLSMGFTPAQVGFYNQQKYANPALAAYAASQSGTADGMPAAKPMSMGVTGLPSPTGATPTRPDVAVGTSYTSDPAPAPSPRRNSSSTSGLTRSLMR
jgi:hypothetical protein